MSLLFRQDKVSIKKNERKLEVLYFRSPLSNIHCGPAFLV